MWEKSRWCTEIFCHTVYSFHNVGREIINRYYLTKIGCKGDYGADRKYWFCELWVPQFYTLHLPFVLSSVV